MFRDETASFEASLAEAEEARDAVEARWRALEEDLAWRQNALARRWRRRAWMLVGVFAPVLLAVVAVKHIPDPEPLPPRPEDARVAELERRLRNARNEVARAKQEAEARRARLRARPAHDENLDALYSAIRTRDPRSHAGSAFVVGAMACARGREDLHARMRKRLSADDREALDRVCGAWETP